MIFQLTKDVGISRFDIFLRALNLSFINPVFGLGAGSFPIIYDAIYFSWKAHPHNLFLELCLSYGYPATVVFVLTLGILLFKSAQTIYKTDVKNNESLIFERSWWTSVFIFLITQLFDVQIFDGRINIIFWVLLSGLKMIIDENTYKVSPIENYS